MSSKKRGLLGGVMRGLGHVGKKSFRFKFEIYIDRLHGLKNGRYKVRFSRGSKGVETNVKAMDDPDGNTMVIFEQKTLGMYTTLYKDEKGKAFDVKDFKLSLIEVQNNAGRRVDRLAGATVLNLADYAGVPSKSSDKTLKLGAGVSASVKLTATFVVGGEEKIEDDAISQDSDLSGLSYDEEEEASHGDDSSASSIHMPSDAGSGSLPEAPRSISGASGSSSHPIVQETPSTSFGEQAAVRVQARVNPDPPVELVEENERLRLELEKREKEILKINTLVRQVSTKSMETQLEAESKLEELQVLNDNLSSELERARIVLDEEKRRADREEKSRSLAQEKSQSAIAPEVVESYKRQIATLEEHVKTLSEEKKAARSKVKAFENHQERLKSTYKNLSDMYNKLRTDYAHLAKKYKSAKVKAVSSQTSTLVAVAHELKLEKLRRERADVMDELNRIRGEQMNEINVAREQRVLAMEELEKLKFDISRLEEDEDILKKLLSERTEKARELDIVNVAVAEEVQRVKGEKEMVEQELTKNAVLVKNLETKIAALDSEVATLREQSEMSSKTEADAVSLLNGMKSSLAELEREKDKEIGALRTERDKLLNELVLASKKNKELQASSEDRVTMINDLEDLRRKMDDEKRRADRETGELRKTIESGAEDLKRVSEELDTTLLKMSLAEKSYGSEIKGLQEELDRSLERLDQMRVESEAMEVATRAELNKALSRVAELEKEVEDVNGMLTTKMERATRDLDDVKARGAREIETMKNTHNVVLTGMEKEFRDKYSRVVTERDTYQKQLFELSDQLDNARADLEVARESMKNDVQSARVELDAAIAEIDRLSKNAFEQEEKNEELRDKISSLEQTKAQHIARLQEAEDKFSALKEESRRKMLEREESLEKARLECESLEEALKAVQQDHTNAINTLELKFNADLEDMRQSKNAIEGQLGILTRERDEALRELESVASQNYEERTQSLSREVAAAREERDLKVVELNSISGKRAELESAVKQKENIIALLVAERDKAKADLETSALKNKATIQELKNEHLRAVEEEEASREKLAQELRALREEYASTREELTSISAKNYDGQMEALHKSLESSNAENKSLNNELEQTRKMLEKRSEAADAEKLKASKDIKTLRGALGETEARLTRTLEDMTHMEEQYKKRLTDLEAEQTALVMNLDKSKKDIEARSAELSELTSLRDRAAKSEYDLRIFEKEKEQLAASLKESKDRAAAVEVDIKRVTEELKQVNRESAAEIKRAQAERDDAVVLLQKTRSMAKGSEEEAGNLKEKLSQYEAKLQQAASDAQRLREDRDKTLKDMDELQAALNQKSSAADASSDKKGKNTEAQLRAAYARERTLQTRVTALIEENKVLKEGIKKGDSFDSVLNDLVQIKVALAIAEEDKLLLRDELRKYKGTDAF